MDKYITLDGVQVSRESLEAAGWTKKESPRLKSAGYMLDDAIDRGWIKYEGSWPVVITPKRGLWLDWFIYHNGVAVSKKDIDSDGIPDNWVERVANVTTRLGYMVTSSMDSETVRAEYKCDSCGQHGIDFSAKFCPNCGKRFRGVII